MAIATQLRRYRDRLPPWLRPRGTRYQGVSSSQSATLSSKRIFILPTRPGLVFICLLLIMLLGATNYGNNMAFALTFLVGGVTLISIFNAYNNLKGLEIKSGVVEDCFAGQHAIFSVNLSDPHAHNHLDILLWGDNITPTHTSVMNGNTALAQLALVTTKRGLISPGRIVIASAYPMGLFRAWAYIDIETQALVYPAPSNSAHPAPNQSAAGEGQQTNEPGSDDFHGFRSYANGDSLRHINWKAFARERGLITKQFHRHQSPELWFDWQASGNGNTEVRLSRLCRWILDAERRGHHYGLRMPNNEIPPNQGPAHQRSCLKQLALFER